MIQLYILRSPEGKVRYVGACRDPKQQLQRYQRDAVTGRLPLHRWLRHLQVRNQEPKLRFLHEVEDDEREHAQKWWVHYFIKRGADLLNEIEAPRMNGKPVLMEDFSRLKRGDVVVMRRTAERFTITDPPIPGSMTAWGKPEGQKPKWPLPLWRMRVGRICTREL